MKLTQNYKSLKQHVSKELAVVWHLSRYDLTATVVPATLFLISANLATNNPNWAASVIKSLLYFSFYILSFNSSNQSRIEEDLFNKKKRALSMGLITEEGSRIRWYIYSIIFLIIGLLFNTAIWALFWFMIVFCHNQLRFANNWFAKNALMGLGTFVQLTAAWELAAPLNDNSLRWIAAISLIIFLVVGIQDIRDIVGDALVGRITLPILLGEHRAKLYFAVAMILAPVIIFGTQVYPKPVQFGEAVHFSLIALFALWISIRLLLLNKHNEEQHTYTLLTLFYCFTLPFVYWVY